MNYFKLFSLPQVFDIDLKLLTKKFYQLQRKFHPDKLQNNTKLNKKKMLENSILINNGHQILKDPLKRAEYILLLNGFNLHDKKNISCNQSFLRKQFQFYEEIEKIKKLPLNFIHLKNTLDRIEKIKKNYDNKLQKNLKDKRWNKAMLILYKLLFFKKIKTNLENLKM